MKKLIPLLIVLASPLAAQDALTLEVTPPDQGEAPSVFENLFGTLFGGFFKDIEPQLQDLAGVAEALAPKMQSFVERFGQEMSDVLDKVGDIRNYAAPEILENGDILLRRLPEAAPLVPESTTESFDL